MLCVEFENRLSDLLDERISPSVDSGLLEHAQNCPLCSELLAAHEVLLEGIQALPTARLCEVERQALAHCVVEEVGSQPREPFPTVSKVGLAERRPWVVAANSVAPVGLIALALATAAAVLITVLPSFRGDPQPAVPQPHRQLIVDTHRHPLPNSPTAALAWSDYEDLAPLARAVGFQVADGLTPVTNSMVSVLRELRKRQFFRNSDEQQRSSFYSPRDDDQIVA